MSERPSTDAIPEEWRASVLRLTAFPGLSSATSGEGWWEEIVGQPPDETSHRRSGELQVVGEGAVGRLILTIDPVRIDWRLASIEDEMLLAGDLSTVALFSQSLEAFLQLMFRWLEGRSLEINRIAFGAELLLPAESHSAAYSLLSSYLPSVKLDPERSSDFLYQINRPRDSRIDIPELRINRLSKWSGLKLSRGIVLPNGQSISFPGMEQYYCRLELDINTFSEFEGFLPSGRLFEIFQELVELGKEIAKEGDIP